MGLVASSAGLVVLVVTGKKLSETVRLLHHRHLRRWDVHPVPRLIGQSTPITIIRLATRQGIVPQRSTVVWRMVKMGWHMVTTLLTVTPLFQLDAPMVH